MLGLIVRPEILWVRIAYLLRLWQSEYLERYAMRTLRFIFSRALLWFTLSPNLRQEMAVLYE